MIKGVGMPLSEQTVDVASLAREVARVVAPTEQRAVDALLVGYANDLSAIGRTLKDRRTGEDMGFGLREIGAFAPYIINASYVVIAWLAAQVGDALGEPVRNATSRLMARLTNRRRGAHSNQVKLSTALTAAQLAAVRQVVLKTIAPAALPAGWGALLADAVVGALAAPGAPPESDAP